MKAHRTDVLSLVFGLLFLAVVLGFTAQSMFNLRLPDIRWFLAGGGVLVGLIVLVTALAPDRASRKAAQNDGAQNEEVAQAQPEDADQASRPMLTE
jgi:hypothetical protein